MIINSDRLTAAAGLCAVAAGAIFLTVQINHPPLNADTVVTTEVIARNTAKAVMAMLALAGITGMYLRQVQRLGVLGLLGYLLFAVGYFAMFCVETIGAFVLPTLAGSAPGYVEDLLAVAEGGAAAGDVGAMQLVLGIAGIGYLGGGLLFGISLFRAGVLSRWASLLLAIGTTATLSLRVLPDSFNRPLAVPVAIALIGLGISLWRVARQPKSEVREPAGAEHLAVR